VIGRFDCAFTDVSPSCANSACAYVKAGVVALNSGKGVTRWFGCGEQGSIKKRTSGVLTLQNCDVSAVARDRVTPCFGVMCHGAGIIVVEPRFLVQCIDRGDASKLPILGALSAESAANEAVNVRKLLESSPSLCRNLP